MKAQIMEAAAKGCYIDHEYKSLGYRCFADLDGTEARKFLENAGFNVVKNYDTGNNGVAITDDGIYLSTNGYIHKK